MIDIIIDIETLGTKPGCIILEIGACAMNPDTGRIVANFGRRLDEMFIGDHPFTDDMRETIEWWHGPDRVATYYALIRRGLPGMFPRNPRDPRTDLEAFCAWWKSVTDGHDPKRVRVWANGPSFDISILCAAFDRYGVERPWVCWQERCVRTALEMAGYERGSVPWDEAGPRHRAINDARHEAKKLWACGAFGGVSELRRRLIQRGTIKEAQA